MLGIKNKIAKKLAGFVAPYLTPETPEKSVILEADVTHGRQVINKANCSPMSQEALLTSQEAAQLLKLSFQRTAAEFMVSQEGKPSYALDSNEDCKLSVKNMFGMDGVANAVIYTFFAKHGFIGWQLCSMLSQHWLINRACRLPNEDALAPGWKLDWQNGNGSEEESEEKEKKAEILKECVEVANKKFNLAEKALRFGINRSIYGQALAYFIIEGEDPSTPLNIDGIKPGSFKGINVVEPYWAFPDWKIDSMNPGSLSFYRPEFYTIGGQRIHRSRLVVKPFVELPDVLKPSYYFGGIPLTQMIYERVYAAEKTANEVPELALTKRMLVVDANMADFVANPEVMASKMNLLSKFRNNNGVFFKDRPDQVTQVDTNLSDLDANVWTQYQLVASVSSLPADRLLCTSPKGFQSTGEYEQRTYAQTLKSAYQEFAFREFLEKAHAIVMKSELGVSDPFVLNFNPIDTPTEAEKAQTLLTKASRDAALVNAGIISPEEARGALIADKESGYGDISAEAPEMGDLAQLQGLLGPEGGQEQQPGQDKATDSADWDENKHPRKKNGQFGTGSGESSENSKNDETQTEKKSEEKPTSQKIDKESILKDTPSEYRSKAREFFNNAVNNIGLGQLEEYSYADVDSKEAEEIKEATGLDITGYKHSITNTGVRHAQNDHGRKETEEPQGQVPITEEDIELVPYITKNYDAVMLAPGLSEGRPVLMYRKKIDNEYVYLEIVLGKNKKQLRFKSMWKKKN